MGVPEHQPWFCCWLREEQKPSPKTAGIKQGPHKAARQPKAHQERKGICPGSHSKTGVEGTRIQAS